MTGSQVRRKTQSQAAGCLRPRGTKPPIQHSPASASLPPARTGGVLTLFVERLCGQAPRHRDASPGSAAGATFPPASVLRPDGGARCRHEPSDKRRGASDRPPAGFENPWRPHRRNPQLRSALSLGQVRFLGRLFTDFTRLSKCNRRRQTHAGAPWDAYGCAWSSKFTVHSFDGCHPAADGSCRFQQ